MAQTADHLVEQVIPRVPVRQWVLSFPIPRRYLFASHPDLLSPVLQVVNRAVSTFLIKQASLKRTDTQTGAVTLTRTVPGTPPSGVLRTSHFAPDKMVIQRFGSAANLNIHLHCLFLDGVCLVPMAAHRYFSPYPRLPSSNYKPCSAGS